MDSFYETLPSFPEFGSMTDPAHYKKLHSDWGVIITDIKGSTQAIAAGRYKDVNTIGAATIVVVTKALKSDFPFVFGGDGATLLIPLSQKKNVLEALSSLRHLSKKNYDLELRIGFIPAEELERLGAVVEVAKFEMTKGRSVACLRGNGLPLAEKLIKAQDSKYLIEENEFRSPDLSDLSCRWSPVPSVKGKILSLLVVSRKGDGIYKEFLKFLEDIIPGGMNSANPGRLEKAKYQPLREILKSEIRLGGNLFQKLYRIVEILLSEIVFRLNLPVPFIRIKEYQDSIHSHSDYRKFDDVLRMILDCTTREVTSILIWLEDSYQKGDLYYGNFQSDSSLMTCFVGNLTQGEHIHFIDANDGGYAAAAVGLKAQMKKDL